MKIRQILHILTIASFVVTFSWAQSQIPTTDLKFWLRGDSNVLFVNNIVTSWNDVSGNMYVASQPNTAARPTRKFDDQIESEVIDFDGINDLLLMDLNLPVPQPNTYFIVWKIEGNATVQIPFASSPDPNALVWVNLTGATNQMRLNGGSSTYFYDKSAPFSYILTTCEFNGSTSKMYENGSLKSTQNSGSSNLSPIVEIGGLTSQAMAFPSIPGWFDGCIAELIMYDGMLSNLDREQVENYLANKYSSPIDLGPDLNPCAPSVKIGIDPSKMYQDVVWSNTQVGIDSIEITQNGTYWVSATSFGLSITDTIVITGIVPPPSISISNDTILCFGDSLVINYSPSPGFSVAWSNGDTTNQTTIKDFSQEISLTHTDMNGCSATTNTYSVSLDSLILKSTLGPDRNICDGGNVLVETSSAQGPFQYTWNTGDTTMSTIPPSPGTQEISIEMVDVNGCTFHDTVIINAVNLPAPTIDFVFDTVCPFNPTSFTDISTTSGSDTINSWEWNFANLGSANVANPQFVFDPGVFIVGLTVGTDSGCFNSITKIVRTHKQPVANIEQVILCAGGEGLAENNSFVSFPDVLVDYEWTIDGNIYSGSAPNVTIQNPGDTEFFLEVISDKGCADTITEIIEIFPPISPDFVVQDPCLGDSTSFIDITPSFSIIERLWSFGVLGQFSSIKDPKYLYGNSGTYTVKLSLENALGCSDAIEKTIEIHEIPIADLSLNNACPNAATLIYDASLVLNGFVQEMTWEIEGNTFIGDSVYYNFDTVGTYFINHSIVDNFGCSNDTTIAIEINPNPVVDFSFDPSYGEAPLDVIFTNSSNGASSYLWNFGYQDSTSTTVEPIFTYPENGSYNISLTAYSDFGCTDTAIDVVNVIPTELDLELSNLSFQKSPLGDGALNYQPSVILKNVGSRPIQNVDLYVSVDNESKIAETWTGNLGIGQSLLYNFNAFFVVYEEESLQYFCVAGSNVNDNTEEILGNNKVCLIQNGLLQSSNVFPNPARTEAFVDIISKNSGVMDVEILESLGKKILHFENIPLDKGFNQYSIDCNTLQSGVYYVNIIFQDETYSKKLFISNK